MLKEMKKSGDAGLMQFNEDFTGVMRGEQVKGRTFKWSFDESSNANRLTIQGDSDGEPWMEHWMFEISEDGTITLGNNKSKKPSTLLECKYLAVGNKVVDSNLN